MQFMPNDEIPASEPASGEGAIADDLLDLRIDLEDHLPDTFVPAWHFMQDYPFLLVVLLFLLGYLVGKGLQWVLRTTLCHAANRTHSKLDDELVFHLTAPVVKTTVILALVVAQQAFAFGDAVDWVLTRLLFSLLIFFWGRAVFKATKLLIEVLAVKPEVTGLMQPRTRPLFEMGVKVFLFSILVWLYMTLWNIDGTAWLASAGVIGIAVGFAARDTLANLISGVSIVADAPYKLGDYVVLDTGERGVVTHLGMRSTRLLTRDDVEISIPNAVMGMAKITNESGGPAVEHRIRIPIGVAYGTRPRKVVELLEQVAKENSLILDHPAPRVRMRAFGESSLNFELLGWIKYPEQRGLARHNLLIEIETLFNEEGIHIPFPQRDVYLRTPQQDEAPEA